MLKAAMNGGRISRSKALYMAPSLIHHIHPPDDCFGLTGCASPSEDLLSGTGTFCLELDRTVAELTAVGLSKVRHLKVQIVEKEGHWFALNSAQLELCRRLEKDGLCAKVKVDVVPSHEVPLNVRNLMTLPVYGAVTKKSKEKEEEEEEEEGQLTNEERSVSPANRACGIVVRGRKGYQQLDQDDEEDDEDEEKDRTEDKTIRSNASNNETNHDEDEDDGTEDGSSPGASGESAIDWSEEEDCNLSSSSAGEWSDVEDGDHGNCSDVVVDGIMTSEEDEDDEDEGNCLL